MELFDAQVVEVNRLEEKNAELEHQLRVVRQQLAQAASADRNAASQLTHQATQLDRRAQQLQDLRSTTDSLTRSLDQREVELRAEKSRAQAAESRVQDLQRRLDAVEEQWRERQADWTNSLSSEREQNVRLREEVRRGREELAACRRASSDQQEIERLCSKYREEAHEWSQRAREHLDTVRSLQRRLAAAEGERDTAQARGDALAKKLPSLLAEVRRLRSALGLMRSSMVSSLTELQLAQESAVQHVAHRCEVSDKKLAESQRVIERQRSQIQTQATTIGGLEQRAGALQKAASTKKKTAASELRHTYTELQAVNADLQKEVAVLQARLQRIENRQPTAVVVSSRRVPAPTDSNAVASHTAHAPPRSHREVSLFTPGGAHITLHARDVRHSKVPRRSRRSDDVPPGRLERRSRSTRRDRGYHRGGRRNGSGLSSELNKLQKAATREILSAKKKGRPADAQLLQYKAGLDSIVKRAHRGHHK